MGSQPVTETAWAGSLCQGLHLFSRFLPQLGHQGHVLPVGAARAQDLGEGVLPHKGPGGHGHEAVVPHQVAQLNEAVVVVPVAVQHHGHPQGAVPLDVVPHIGHQQVGHPPGVHRGAQHHQVLRPEGQVLLPGLGQVEAVSIVPGPQALRQILGQGGGHLLGGAGAAEIDGPDRFDVHLYFLLTHMLVRLRQGQCAQAGMCARKSAWCRCSTYSGPCRLAQLGLHVRGSPGGPSGPGASGPLLDEQQGPVLLLGQVVGVALDSPPLPGWRPEGRSPGLCVRKASRCPGRMV